MRFRITVKPNPEPDRGFWRWTLEQLHDENIDLWGRVAEGVSDDKGFAAERAVEHAQRITNNPPTTTELEIDNG